MRARAGEGGWPSLGLSFFLPMWVPKKSSKVFRRGLKMSMSHFCRA